MEWLDNLLPALLVTSIKYGSNDRGEYGVFSGCTSLKSVIIPESVTEICGGAFSGCTSLESITIPPSVQIIDGEEYGGGAFSHCVALENVILSEGLTEIGEDAFSYCALRSIAIPASVKTIKPGAFKGCTSLESFSGPLATDDGRGLVIDGKLVGVLQRNLTEFVVPEGVTEIEKYAFQGCSSLKNISLEEGVTVIAERAFDECESLREISLPDSLTTIGKDLLIRCSSLECIKVGPKLFADTKYLKETFPVQQYRMIQKTNNCQRSKPPTITKKHPEIGVLFCYHKLCCFKTHPNHN